MTPRPRTAEFTSAAPLSGPPCSGAAGSPRGGRAACGEGDRNPRRGEDAALPSHWTQRALCRAHDPDLWFPPSARAKPAAVISVCRKCPVRADCLTFAYQMENEVGSMPGIWGGLTQSERAGGNVRKAGPESRRPREVAPCGTRAAVRRHHRRKEPLCDACHAAKQRTNAEAYDRQRVQRLRNLAGGTS